MLHDQTTIQKHIYITNQLETMSTFGIDPESGEQVFISARLANQFDLREGDYVMCLVVPNRVPENKVPWYAMFVRKVSTPESPPQTLICDADSSDDSVPEATSPPAVPREITQSEILDYLKDGLASAKEIATSLGGDTTQTTNELTKLHRGGEVARSEIRAKRDQVRASHVLWALNVEDFLP